ncbi:MAG: RnfABCDGE type electron transport complex subunit D [Phascolarctobacterium faecium]
MAALRLAESAWQRGLNVDLPSLSALFWGNVGGSLGETCVPALLLGGIYLLWQDTSTGVSLLAISARLSLLLLFTAGCANIRPGLPFIICSGGLIIGAFFMATDRVTSPITKRPADLRTRSWHPSIDPPARRL